MTSPGERIFAVLLRAYPRAFRQRYEDDLLAFFRADQHHSRYGLGPLRLARFWWATLRDLLHAAAAERFALARRRPGADRSALREVQGISIDLRDAWRRLARTPGASFVAIATLALGIGVTTAVFALAYGIWLKPLPYRDAERLVTLFSRHGPSGRTASMSGPEIEEYRHAGAFEDLAEYAYGAAVAVINGERVRIVAHRVSPNLFDVLGVAPARGPGFSRGGPAPEVILSEPFWRRQFGGDPGAIGRAYKMNDELLTIVGIMPGGFKFPQILEGDVWVRTEHWSTDGNTRFQNAVARLRPGRTIDDAKRDLAVLSRRLAAAYPASNRDWSGDARALPDELRASYARPFGTLAGITALLLALACANAAAILLTRTASRRGELAMRIALGATRLRLAREQLTEGVLFAVLATTAGIALAVASIPLFKSLLPARTPRLDEVHLDPRVLAAMVVAAAATALVCGLVPLLAQRSLPPTLAFAGLDRRLAGDPSRRPLRVLAVGEIALTVLLMVTAVLMIRSFVALVDRDRGFDAGRLLTLDVSLPFMDERYENVRTRLDAFERLLDRVAQVPGVMRAGATTGFPGSALGVLGVATVQADAASPTVVAALHACSNEYFAVMDTPLESGRPFDRRDATDFNIILSHTLAARLWPGGGATGRTLVLPPIRGISETPQTYRVVGVAADMRLTGEATPRLFLPLARAGYWIDLVVRTRVDPRAVSGAVRAALLEADPNLLIENVRGMDRIVDESVALQRAQTLLTSLVAGLATLLAAAGLYGLLSYAIVRRMRELGVRLALGARPSGVFGSVVRDAVTLTAVGCAFGLGAAAVAIRLLRHEVFGIGAAHWTAFAAAPLLMLLVAVGAVWAPARRAATVDPLTVMREG